MYNENKKQTNKIDWKKKGLGWIPDYPDLRDYQLDHKDIQKDGRLKREAATHAIENLSENLIEIISVLQSYLSDRKQRGNLGKLELEQQISEIANQAFGGISFVKVRLHRLLREQTNEQKSSCVLFDSQRQSQRSKQIVELKNYLSILVLRGYLKLPGELKKTSQNQILFNNLKLDEFDLDENPTQIVSWLRKENFDQTTKFLVMQFQQGSGILVDGIVGLETYTTLSEHFSKPGQLEKLKNCIEQLQKETSEKPCSEKPSYSPKTRLVSVPSLIPSTLFTLIRDELKSSAAEQLLKEFQDYQRIPSVAEKILEVDFLKNIGVEEDCGIFVTLMGEHFKNFNKTEPQSFIDNILEANQLAAPEAFAQIFYNEFFVVEPLVSFVLKIMSPLARYKNVPLEKVVSDALKAAKGVFHKAFPKNEELTPIANSPDAKNTDAMFHPVGMEELAKEALYQVAHLFEPGIKLLVQENRNNKNKNEVKSALCFYFIVKKFLNQFISTSQQCEVINNRQPNVFDKQELFELKKLPDWQKIGLFSEKAQSGKVTSDKNQLQLFPTQELQIPVTNSLIKSYTSRGLLDPQSPKPYLFLPSVVDLSYWDSAVEDQGTLQACTAFAGIALIEYFANRSRAKSTDLSPLFLYKAARNLMSLNGDVGASVRETMKAMALFGVPPEQYWTYEEDKVDEEPPPFCYSYAQNFQALKYFRLDYAGIATEVLLSQIKAVLAAGFPCMFGFTIYTSAYDNFNIDQGYIPFPSVEKDRVVGGHAVVAVGYDDLQTIPCAEHTGISHGAFLIRNSWGTDWGKEGYGWIPYDYILQGLTRDWWSLIKSEWFDEDSYGLGARNMGGDQPELGQIGGNR